jgi:hypothetical protein
LGVLVIVEDSAVQDVGEVPFECPAGLAGCFSFGGFLHVVVAAWAGFAPLADGHGVQHRVELPVASGVEPVSVWLPLEASKGALPM